MHIFLEQQLTTVELTIPIQGISTALRFLQFSLKLICSFLNGKIICIYSSYVINITPLSHGEACYLKA